MTDEPIDLDVHRGMAAQKATEIRRERLHQFQEDQVTLRRRQEELEKHLLARGCGEGRVPHPTLRRNAGSEGSAAQGAYRPCHGRPGTSLRTGKGRLMSVSAMTTEKRGAKHVCSECACKYYDLGKKGASCPKCGGEPVEQQLSSGGRPPKKGLRFFQLSISRMICAFASASINDVWRSARAACALDMDVWR